jgi:hypothetical protein
MLRRRNLRGAKTTHELVLQEWSQWAIQAAIRPEVIAFLRFRPSLLSAFDRICLYLNRLPTGY